MQLRRSCAKTWISGGTPRHVLVSQLACNRLRAASASHEGQAQGQQDRHLRYQSHCNFPPGAMLPCFHSIIAGISCCTTVDQWCQDQARCNVALQLSVAVLNQGCHSLIVYGTLSCTGACSMHSFMHAGIQSSIHSTHFLPRGSNMLSPECVSVGLQHCQSHDAVLYVKTFLQKHKT